MSNTAPYTADTIRALLAADPRAVERAILALYARQTADEQETEATRHDNGAGFNAADARRLSFIATRLQGGMHLRTDTCQRYLPRVAKYARQLADIANANAARKAALQASAESARAEQEAETAYS